MKNKGSIFCKKKELIITKCFKNFTQNFKIRNWTRHKQERDLWLFTNHNSHIQRYQK